ncbi:3-isopropylmalate dehydratase small subunit [Candidatus Bathyarchaeota archaeon]|nr:3-isopropylmalate dehydratase small subunit [Candidatus Bathyarchaeota archaeon]
MTAKTLKLGNNINTDVIIPGRYLESIDPEELGRHALEGLDPTFPNKAKEGVILVAGKNFGCGSSREQAPIALKSAGVRCIIAESFARIFFRNAINIGLPALECEGISRTTSEGDTLSVDLANGIVANKTTGTVMRATPTPQFILKLIEEGGLIPHVRALVERS